MKLDKNHLLVDAAQAPAPYTYTTLQEAALAAQDHTTIYLAPDVYWTDDPEDPNTENNLIGLLLTANDLRLIGLGSSPEETVICGDRGQMDGAIGNWNTLGIAGNDFYAYNITFGNYCNVDLEYAPDPTKNHKKRNSSITQAQVIIPVGEPDRWVFERCRFISLLNVFSYNRKMGRIYYKDCFFQSTDDSIGTGDVNVFENCHFVWYGNHPSGSACETLLVYAHCHFEGRLLYPEYDDKVYLSKNNHRSVALLDCRISGNVREVRYHVDPHPALRGYTYHNAFPVSADHPECSIVLEEYPEVLKAFKVGESYNIWNLMRGADDWDPCGQKEAMAPYGKLPWRVRLAPVEGKVEMNDFLRIQPEQYWFPQKLQWKVQADTNLEFEVQEDGSAVLTNRNTYTEPRIVTIQAVTESGLVGMGQYTLGFAPAQAPGFTCLPKISHEGDLLRVEYALDRDGADDSRIKWYRSSNGETAQAIFTATGKEYALSKRDNGWFLLASVSPKTAESLEGEACWSEPVWVDGIEKTSYHTDFSDLPVTDEIAHTGSSDVPEYPMRPLRNGFWQIGVGRALDYPEKFHWYPKSQPSKPWTYGESFTEGGEAVKGLLTTHRGSRLLFAQAERYPYQRQTWVIRPGKVAGQGFNSPTGQYMDLYIALDAFSMTGYGVRIERTPKYCDGVDFQLYSYVQEKGQPISEAVSTGCFRGDCTIVLTLQEGRLSLDAKSPLPPLQSHIDSGLASEVHLEAPIGEIVGSGWGCWHTGTGGLALRSLDVQTE